MPEPRVLASKIAADLAQIPGVAAVVLGGSHARGEADEKSDIDLGIYYRHEEPVSTGALDKLASSLDDRGRTGLVTQIGDWGPWINGGAWLVIDGFRMDWLYRDLGDVELAIGSVRAGTISTHYQPGHPHAFHNYIYAGEVNHGQPLYDPQRAFARLKAKTLPYPARLKSAIVSKFLWEARFALDTANKSASRRDVAYIAGCLYRSAMCMTQVLFALNERYFLNEKGSITAVEAFSTRPASFGQVVRSVLSEPGRTIDELNASLVRFSKLVDQLERLASP